MRSVEVAAVDALETPAGERLKALAADCAEVFEQDSCNTTLFPALSVALPKRTAQYFGG
jgi:hypothetical protein